MIDGLALCAGGALLGTLQRGGDHWACALRDGAQLLYFLGVRDEAMPTHPNLAPWLPKVATLYVQGFNPCIAAVAAMTALQQVLATVCCRRDDPPTHPFHESSALFHAPDGLRARPDVRILTIPEARFDEEKGAFRLLVCDDSIRVHSVQSDARTLPWDSDDDDWEE